MPLDQPIPWGRALAKLYHWSHGAECCWQGWPWETGHSVSALCPVLLVASHPLSFDTFSPPSPKLLGTAAGKLPHSKRPVPSSRGNSTHRFLSSLRYSFCTGLDLTCFLHPNCPHQLCIPWTCSLCCDLSQEYKQSYLPYFLCLGAEDTNSDFTVMSVWPCFFTPPGLSFLICTVEIIITPLHRFFLRSQS